MPGIADDLGVAPPQGRSRTHNGRVTVRREVAFSALLSTLAAAAIGVGGFWAARTVATGEAIHQAEQATGCWLRR